MPLLLATLLLILTPINLRAYKENFRPFTTVDFFFQDVGYQYDNLLEILNLLTLHNRRRHFDALFLMNVFIGTKYFLSALKTLSIRVPARNIRNFTLFTCSSNHYSSARCVSAANAVWKPGDICSNSCFNVNNIN
jgi:hypothetical protein